MPSSSAPSAFLKPAVAAGVTVAIDKMYFKESDMKRSLMFGAAVGASMYGAKILEDAGWIPQILPDMGTMANGLSVQNRLMEVGIGAGAGYAINKFVLKNTSPYSRDDMMRYIGTIVVADLVSEAVLDLYTGATINPFD